MSNKAPAATPGQAAHAGYLENDTKNLVAGEDVAARIWARMGHGRTRWERAAQRGHEAIAAQDAQPAPELAQVLSSPAELALWVEASHGDHPEWVDELRALLPASGQPAPELAAAMAESRLLRNLIDDFTHAVIDTTGRASLAAAARAVRKKAGLKPVTEGKRP